MIRALLLILTSVLCLTMTTQAQETIRAQVSRDSIRIGEQIEYTIEIPTAVLTGEDFTVFADSIGAFTVVSPTDIDSTEDLVFLRTVLTVFDSGVWTLPAYKYGEMSSPSLTIYTATVPVDTAQPFRDIYGLKEVKKPGASYAWFWLLLLIPLFYFLYKKYKNRTPAPSSDLPIQKVGTPYERAVAAVDELEEQEPWRDPLQVKNYYDQLTDIMRQYFSEEFGVQAMESTSTELLQNIKQYSQINQRREDIRWVLQQADLAKFAESRPTIDVSEDALSRVKFILKWTRPRDRKPEDNA